MGAPAAGAAASAAPLLLPALPPPLMAATALWQADDNLAEWLCRHCKAAAPPGWTPEQLAMKSERQAARIADFCASVGCAGAVGAAAGGATGSAAGACDTIDFLLGVFVCFFSGAGAGAGDCAAGGGELWTAL